MSYQYNVCQKVDLLPFERYDQVKSVIETISKMYKTMEHSDCNADDCKWKRYHADLTSMGQDSKFMDCVIDHISWSNNGRLLAVANPIDLKPWIVPRVTFISASCLFGSIISSTVNNTIT